MRKGFTLAELLTVVLIVSVLMGVGLPQYRKAVDRARVAEAEGMLRSIYDSSERLAGEFGYRNYVALARSRGFSFNRFDMFDETQLPSGCNLNASDDTLELGASAPSANGLMYCTRFVYKALVRGSNNVDYVAARLLTGRHKGTYILFDRDTQTLYCQPRVGRDSTFCDMLGLDVVNAGIDF